MCSFAITEIVHHSKSGRSTSALGQKRIFRDLRLMSALPPKADIRHVGGVPIKSRFPISTPHWRMMS
jgi:hypothetical protein